MGMKTVDEVQDIEDVDYEEINHEDVVEKVNKEKSSQANKTEIGMDAPSEQADDSTREDKEGKSASAPSGKAAPNGNDGHLPGF